MTEKFRTYNPSTDEGPVQALWDRVFPNPKGGQNIDWLFRDSPAGPPARSVVEMDGKIVAHAGAAPIRFRLNGAECLGGYSVAAMTDALMRGRGLYVQLSRFLYEQMRQSDFPFVAGFSNRNSHRLMVEQLGRVPIRPFPWCIRVLRPLLLIGSLLRRRVDSAPAICFEETAFQGIQISPCSADDARYDEIWLRSRASISVGAIRDTEFIRWRFGSRPDAKYRCLIATSKDQPAAYAIYRTLGFRGIPAGFIVDFLVSPGEEAAGLALLAYITKTARRGGVAILSALLPPKSPTRTALERSGFLRVPEFLHPQTIRFSVLDLRKNYGNSELYDPGKWFLSWADTDIV